MPDPIELAPSCIPVAAWKTRDEAIDWLADDFTDWLRAINDLVSADAHIDSMMLEGFACIAHGLAAYLRDPAPVVIHREESAGHALSLTRSLEGLHARIAEAQGLQYAMRDGLITGISDRTPLILGRAVRSAVEAQEAEINHRLGQIKALRDGLLPPRRPA
jgi:hypothetical protein